MNILRGEIASVEIMKSLSLVKIMVGPYQITSIVIDTPDSSDYLKIGKQVKVIFKETEVILGVGNGHKISLQNKLEGKVTSIESGELLSKIVMTTEVGEIVSVITTNAVNQLKLKIGSPVTAMVKTNEVMLSE